MIYHKETSEAKLMLLGRMNSQQSKKLPCCVIFQEIVHIRLRVR